MKLKSLQGSALALLVGMSLPAKAETTTLSQSGYWKTFGGTAENGVPMCGIMTSNNRDRSFMIKWYKGLPGLVIHLYKDGWNVPRNTKFPFQLQFDELSPWNGNASGTTTPNLIEVDVPDAKIEQFLNEVRFSNHVKVIFPTGTEGSWSGSMVGSNAAIIAFAQCYQRTMGLPPPQSQPYSSPQPFQAAPSPQPYSPQPSSPDGSRTSAGSI